MKNMLEGFTKKIKKGRASILYKLVITYLCISIPIYCLYLCLYQYALSNMKEQTEFFFTGQADFFLNEWEKEIDNINNMLQFYTIDQDVELVAVIPQSISYYDRIFRMNQIAKKLVMVRYGSKYAKDTMLYLPSVSKVISVDNGITDLDMNKFRDLESRLKESPDGFLFVNGEDEDTLYLARNSPLIKGESKLQSSYILLTELSIGDIQQSLETFAFTENTRTLLIHPGGELNISSEDTQGEAFLQASRSAEKPSAQVELEGVKYQRFISKSAKGSFSLACFVPENELYPFMSTLNVWMFMFFLIALLMVVGFSISLHRLIKKPIDTLVTQFAGNAEGELLPYYGYGKEDEFKRLFASYNTMVERIRRLIDQVYFQRILAQKAELKQLQAQINPHFLYNSFFTLSLLARSGDTDQVELFAKTLGEYFRYITRNSQETATLQQEFAHAKRYGEIQQLRFGNRLTVEMEPPPQELGELKMPRLILQPLLENAFVHGLESKREGAVLRVFWESGENVLRILFDDNGVRPTPIQLQQLERDMEDMEKRMETTALINIHRRLRLHYNNPSGLDVSESPMGGWRVRVNIYYKAQRDLPRKEEGEK